MKTYMIIRHKFNDNNSIIKKGLTLEQAQEHCQREDTHGEGWFDGYMEENKPCLIRKASLTSLV
jgi:hypothetical protein